MDGRVIAGGDRVFAADDRLRSYLVEEVGLDLSRVDLDALVDSLPANGQDLASFASFSSCVSSQIAVHETYFMRHREQFDWIAGVWLPQVLPGKARHGKTVRILSAGCSTGEEPYSLCATLKPLCDLVGVGLEIDAIDICERSLETARQGRYGLWSLRGVSAGQEAGWLTVKSRVVQVQDWVKQGVNFYRQNITRPLAFPGNRYDLILCRNVMIYMHAEAINKTYRQLAGLLQPDGYLIPGPSDPNPMGEAGLAWRWEGGVRLMQRKMEEPPSLAGLAAVMPAAVPAMHRDSAAAVQVPAALAPQEALPAAVPLAHISHLVSHCRYDEARQALEQNIRLDPLDAASHIVLAMLAMDLGELQVAATAVRAAQFLRPDSAYAAYLMANYRKARGDAAGEYACLRRAQELLQALEGQGQVEFCEEYTVAALLQVIDARLACT